jgi:hypothetical protein
MSASTSSLDLHTSAADGPRPTAEQVWKAVTGASFAVLSHVTPAGQPRSSGVVYTVAGDRMYVVVAKNSWKARQIATSADVAVTVPVRRGGIMSLLFPIPPATISFPAHAVVHPAAALRDFPHLAKLARLIPSERREACSIIEIRPVGHYVTYGLGVPLARMRDTTRSRARVAVAGSA